jgi:hypothetical protein
MKTLLLFICLISIETQAQVVPLKGSETTKGVMTTADLAKLEKLTVNRYLYDSVSTPKNDTIPVFMLVCDTAGYYDDLTYGLYQKNTSAQNNYRRQNEGIAIWMRGYVVRGPGAILGPGQPYYHKIIAYLDQNKKPLTYLVWDTRRVKNGI